MDQKHDAGVFQEMRNHTTVLLSVGVLVVALACSNDRYQITQDKEGRTIRLDRKTGDVAIIADDRLVIPKTPQQQETEEKQRRGSEKVLAEPKPWPSQDFKAIDVSDATVVTAWRDGSLYYQLEMKPFPKRYEQSVSPTPLNVKFTDKAGFAVVEIELKRTQLALM